MHELATRRTQNPFTPTFGMVPLSLAGRDDLIDDVIEGLENRPGDPNRATIFIGPRGSGKTVLLTTLADMADSMGWLSANVTARPEMLEEILEQLQTKGGHLLSDRSPSRITSIQAAGIGISRTPVEEGSRTWRSRVTETVRELNEKGCGVLFTIDEVSAGETALGSFVDVFQHLVRERLNVAVLFAGLPSMVSALLLENAATFLRRAFQRDLGPIGLSDVAISMQTTIEEAGRFITDDALELAAETTGGYAYLIQLIGYYLWCQHPKAKTIVAGDVGMATSLAMHEMERAVFRPMLQELSSREHQFLQAMACSSKPAPMADIMTAMNISASNAANLRRRLIDRGIIHSAGRGFVEFDMPLLREHLLERAET